MALLRRFALFPEGYLYGGGDIRFAEVHNLFKLHFDVLGEHLLLG
jgi:hypothetical protein